MIEKMCNQMLHTYNSKASHVGQRKVGDHNATAEQREDATEAPHFCQ